MKKLVILSFLLTLSVGLMAQRSGSTTVLGDGSISNLTMTTADTITHSGTGYWIFDIGKNRPPYYYAFALAIDTVKHTNVRTYWNVYGSLNGTDWVASGITQVNLFHTDGSVGTDTTFQMVNVTTPQVWRYLKISGTALSTSVYGPRVKAIGLKVANKYQ